MTASTQFDGSAPWLRGEWVRRKYTVVDGFIKPDCSQPIDPYRPFSSGHDEGEDTGGQALVPDLASLDPKNQQEVAEFATHWGLLGLCLHSLWEIEYAPTSSGDILLRHNPPPSYYPAVREGIDFKIQISSYGDTHQRYKAQIESRMVELGWVEQGETSGPGRAAVTELGRRTALESWKRHDRASEPLDPWWDDLETNPSTQHMLLENLAKGQLAAQWYSDWDADPDRRGRVWLSGSRSVSPGEYPLDQWCRLFFPDLYSRRAARVEQLGGTCPLAEEVAFPSLTSPHLWDHLCEPLSLFEQAVGRFKSTASACATWKKVVEESKDHKSPDDLLDYYLSEEWPWLKAQIDANVRRVHPVITNRPDSPWSLNENWVWPSLLSCAYWRLLREISGGRFPRDCAREDCPRFFISERPDKVFCSSNCSALVRVRRARQRTATQAPSKNIARASETRQ